MSLVVQLWCWCWCCVVVLCCVRKGSAFRAHRLLLRSPGIEPGSSAWQAPIITIRPRATAWKQRTPPACTIHQANTSNSGTGKAHRTSAQARTRTTRTQGQGEHRSRTNERTNTTRTTQHATRRRRNEGEGNPLPMHMYATTGMERRQRPAAGTG